MTSLALAANEGQEPAQEAGGGFLARARAEIGAAVDLELRPLGRSTADCPYLAAAMLRYSTYTPAELEAVARRYTGSTGDVEALHAALVARARSAAQRWAASQGAELDMPGEVMPVQPYKEHGAPTGLRVDPRRALGPGRPLPGDTRQTMERGFGVDLGGVRVHDGAAAGAVARREQARAFTVGQDIGFAAGEWQPHSPVGQAILAHEIAHTLQQRQAPTSAGGLESDADSAALAALQHLRGGPVPSVAGAGLRLQRCGGGGDGTPADAGVIAGVPVPAVPTTSGPDQRVDGGVTAAVPDADLAREIGYELEPGSRPAPVAPPPLGSPLPPTPPRTPWDGATSNAASAANRATMQGELFNAYDDYINAFLPSTTAALTRPRVALTAAAPSSTGPAPTGVVDIANGARGVLESRYGTSMDAAVTTAGQTAGRSARTAGPVGQNIFDSSIEADRATMTGSTNLAPAVAWWLLENDRPGSRARNGTRLHASEVLARHHYSSTDDPGDAYRWAVAHAYASASTLAPNNQRQLIDYRMTGWSERGTLGITLNARFDPGTNATSAELDQRWSLFKTAVHESLHLRAHPALVAAEQGRGTLKEGFTEMFTVSTLGVVIPQVRAGSQEPLRRIVEGALTTPTPDATHVTDRVTPAQYVDHRAQAERIRDGGTPPGGTAHAGIGEAAVRAVYFQGHVEYIGLDPTGAPLAGLPAAGAVRRLTIPAGITTVTDLATRANVPQTTLEADNPGIAAALPATAVLAGCREHVVVASGTDVETRANIAAQNGVSEAALVAANPHISVDASTNAWPTLSAGQRILVPAH